ncbi:MAG: hypothetical protein KDD90_03160 [Sphingomonadaceae bacterium]|nr:hypothetical protein [Sphingomonadaceae bacterium]
MKCVTKTSLVALAIGSTPLAAQEQGAPVEIVNGGFEQGMAGWSSTTEKDEGYHILFDDDAAEGETSLQLFSTRSDSARGFAALTQAINAQELRGRRIRLTAQVKVEPSVTASKFGLWLRVDRAGGRPGFFDNMGDRPISEPQWREYSIEGDVARDAENVLFGMILNGKGAGRIDAVCITDLGPAESAGTRTRVGPPRTAPIEGDVAAAPIDPRGVENLRTFARLYGLVRWFHPSDEAVATDWDTLAIAAAPHVEAATTPDELAQVLRETFLPVAPSVQIVAGDLTALAIPITSNAPRIAWVHKGLGSGGSVYSSERAVLADDEVRDAYRAQLPGGIAAYVPLNVIRGEDETFPRATESLVASGKPEGWQPAGFDRTTRIVGAISSWTMLDHFYPYWDTVDIDWDAELAPLLQGAAQAADDNAYDTVLRRLVARIEDGHGRVVYKDDHSASLPLEWDWIEGQLVVTAAGAEAVGIVPGTIVESIDGVAASDALAAEMALVSGSAQFKRSVALLLLRSSGEEGEHVLALRGPGGATSTVTVPVLSQRSSPAPVESRPENFTDMGDGIIYVDITRMTDDDFATHRQRMVEARGLLFDLRGYPRNSPGWIEHMLEVPGRSPMFLTPIITAPDRPATYPVDGGWKLNPAEPHIAATAVFLTDKRAVSYSESMLGTVRENGLGTIVGGRTAGANGNVAQFDLPGGYRIRFTGMKVVNRDGSQHHILGIEPDISVAPTIDGIRAGRDEVLERGLAELRSKISPADDS